eukprot:TRINITY_DN10591_c0_g1_i1.p1 TRINITY_DN10591_c0_g1~~TRINITY_DN10591_c0_g1_i1.p1  ORF type:complete len:686 (+),score=88.28 TRINITY_DN10591_c0_g1_i1:43-2058(+)
MLCIAPVIAAELAANANPQLVLPPQQRGGRVHRSATLGPGAARPTLPRQPTLSVPEAVRAPTPPPEVTPAAILAAITAISASVAQLSKSILVMQKSLSAVHEAVLPGAPVPQLLTEPTSPRHSDLTSPATKPHTSPSRATNGRGRSKTLRSEGIPRPPPITLHEADGLELRALSTVSAELNIPIPPLSSISRRRATILTPTSQAAAAAAASGQKFDQLDDPLTLAESDSLAPERSGPEETPTADDIISPVASLTDGSRSLGHPTPQSATATFPSPCTEAQEEEKQAERRRHLSVERAVSPMRCREVPACKLVEQSCSPLCPSPKSAPSGFEESRAAKPFEVADISWHESADVVTDKSYTEELSEKTEEQEEEEIEIEHEAHLPTRYQLVRQTLWRVLEEECHTARERNVAHALSVSSFGMVLLSIVAFCLETLPNNIKSPVKSFGGIEIACICFFTLEFLVRLWSTPQRTAFFTSALNIVDLLAIIPFYLQLIISSVFHANHLKLLVFLRALRLTRVLRVLKLGRYNEGMQSLGETILISKDAFSMLLFAMATATILFSSAMYYAELSQSRWDDNSASWILPNNLPSPFQSIPHTFWWCIVTLTTVGYGDAVPFTPYGKLIAAFTALCGVIVLACPTMILSINFSTIHHRRNTIANARAVEEELNRRKGWG